MEEQEVNLGTLYDINKNLMKEEKPLNEIEIKDKIQLIKKFFSSNKKYFMLLCREQYDFTLFNLLINQNHLIEKVTSDLLECLTNRGQIYSIEETPEYNLEIWLKINKNFYVYYLFPYDTGVIEVQ